MSSEIIVTVGTESFVLKRTLEAYRSVPAQLDGFVGAYAKMGQAIPDVCAFIIAAGTGKPLDFAERERIAGLLFEHGVTDVIKPLTAYIDLLMVGPNAKKAAQSDGAGEK